MKTVAFSTGAPLVMRAARTRTLYFSEAEATGGGTDFYITEEGKVPGYLTRAASTPTSLSDRDR